MRKLSHIIIALLFIQCSTQKTLEDTPLQKMELAQHKANKSRMYSPMGYKGMVVSEHPLASQWGVEILKRGGTAMDAAAAVAFMLSVVRTQSSSLGGGGFLVYCPAKKECETLDFREVAGEKSTEKMFIKEGDSNHKLSTVGALASGVPGNVAGYFAGLKKWGKLDKKIILSRPIQVAKNGMRFSGSMEDNAYKLWETIFNPEAKKIFGCKNSNRVCRADQTIIQTDLAKTLEEIAENGARGFYDSWVSQKMVDGLAKAGGILTLNDFKNYQPIFRSPIKAQYGNLEFITMPPPSAGGVMILSMLKYAQFADQAGQFEQGLSSPSSVHALAHAMTLAFADRAQHFGDPKFVNVPVEKLLSAQYLTQRWHETFMPNKANHNINAGLISSNQIPHETTHFSVIDKDGNAASMTITLNTSFGSGFVPPGTGVMMNNQMDDFVTQPGVGNSYGLVGSSANYIAPFKRPLSSMSPTVVRDLNGENRLVIGAWGGPSITTSVFQSLINRIRFNMTLKDAVSAPRVHHQWRPDILRIEKSFLSPILIKEMASYGYQAKESEHLAMVGILFGLERDPETKRVFGALDPRTEGEATAE